MFILFPQISVSLTKKFLFATDGDHSENYNWTKRREQVVSSPAYNPAPLHKSKETSCKACRRIVRAIEVGYFPQDCVSWEWKGNYIHKLPITWPPIDTGQGWHQ